MRPDLQKEGEKLLARLRRQYHRSLYTLEGLTPTQRSLGASPAIMARERRRRTLMSYKSWAEKHGIQPHPASIDWDTYDAYATVTEELDTCPTP